MASIIEAPSVTIEPILLKMLESFEADAGQVVIHGICSGGFSGTYIRIWPTTYLFDHNSAHKSELVHFERISVYPKWTPIPPFENYGFSLIFSGLPDSCTIFDLIEIIPESGGFHIPFITRNNLDVYYLDFN
ncbi:MAG: hypothetical protein J5I52_06970 [Saprospiraceae bacterium]|nr:MAG: hypothetical protein UZ09_BCD002000543 [Bacteroidetes bacterium OLB9]MCO6463875.1 hypothetical protein [Saprospiraceae bacterium]MCZ2339544.1 hypothetical protein [Chitinophagales bacterium]